MLKEFLILYYKKNFKRILSYLILSSFIIIIGLFFEQWLIIFIILSILFIIYYINLEIKQAKICIILDTIHKQKLFYDDFHSDAIKNNKITRFYKKWLLRDIIDSNIEINYKFTASQYINYFCFYCCINFIIMIMISSLILIYIDLFFVLIIDIIFTIFCLAYYIFLHKKSVRDQCQKFDSEIKRIIFEEETGYPPLKNDKFTYKYKVWLFLNERHRY